MGSYRQGRLKFHRVTRVESGSAGRDHYDRITLVASTLAALAAAVSCAISLYSLASNNHDMQVALSDMTAIARETRKQAIASQRLAITAERQSRNAEALALSAQKQADASEAQAIDTGKLAELTARQLVASTENVRIAERQLAELKKSDEIRSKPFLVVRAARVARKEVVSDPYASTAVVELELENIGSTPAYGAAIDGFSVSFDSSSKDRELNDVESRFYNLTAALSNFDPPTIDVSRSQVVELIVPYRMLEIGGMGQGSIKYRSYTGQEESIPFCFRMDVENKDGVRVVGCREFDIKIRGLLEKLGR